MKLQLSISNKVHKQCCRILSIKSYYRLNSCSLKIIMKNNSDHQIQHWSEHFFCTPTCKCIHSLYILRHWCYNPDACLYTDGWKNYSTNSLHQVRTSMSEVCNFFDNRGVWVLDFFIKKSTMGPGLWKLEISNKRLGLGFLNVSEAGPGVQCIWRRVYNLGSLSKTLPNIVLSSLNYSGSLTTTLIITLDFLPSS